LSGFAFHFEIAGLKLALHFVEAFLVVGGCPQGLAARQQKVASKAVLDAHDVAHLAELADTLEQDHFHCRYSSI
jgi:hypothetical protein